MRRKILSLLRKQKNELKPALFMHIQKCAGTSIVDLAAKYYGNANLCSHGDFVDRPPSDFAAVPFVSGHFGYDFARFLMPNRYSFVFLRDPAERILSFYYFCRSRNPNEYEMYKMAHELELDQFLSMALEHPLPKSRLWNNQAWQLAHGYGKQDKRSIMNFKPYELLELAISHMEKFDYIGFTESFEQDKNIVLSHIGIKSSHVAIRSNITSGKPSLVDLPTKTKKLLDELTELDRELYQIALSRSKKNSLRRQK